MVLVADSGSTGSSCGSSQPSTPDNTPNYRFFNRSPLITNSKMVIKHIPLSIAAEIPTTIERNSTNRRTGNSLSNRKTQMESVYANYAHRDANLQLHKLSDDGIRTPQMKTSRYAESGYLSATSKLSPSGSAIEANDSQLSLTSSSNSLYSSMEEKYEAEIRKLNREMQAYRSTITKLTAKHDGYNHVIQLFESKLQLMAKHVENLQNKSQLKKDEILKLRAEIEQLRIMSINAGVNVSGVATITQRKSSSPQAVN
ncbi:unnamed protein product, partial [Onchocerca ochengi]|uniref:cGMP-dependent protein kinase interacting domain-containing protein n=1 Tax=Onchocerca ochengi TaxID=42157 RepID=A0A182EMH0_ONCOC